MSSKHFGNLAWQFKTLSERLLIWFEDGPSLHGSVRLGDGGMTAVCLQLWQQSERVEGKALNAIARVPKGSQLLSCLRPLDVCVHKEWRVGRIPLDRAA
jgi:hypothetical protein